MLQIWKSPAALLILYNQFHNKLILWCAVILSLNPMGGKKGEKKRKKNGKLTKKQTKPTTTKPTNQPKNTCTLKKENKL